MPHTCHAMGCTTPVPRKMFMCLKHWRMVPKALQHLIWETYTPGQERDMEKVSDEYLAAAVAARAYVAKEEYRKIYKESV